MKKPIEFLQIEGRSPAYFGLLGLFGAIVLISLYAFYQMEHNGHHITGMTNQIVWGIPHVFAIFLIIAASGALNIASISSVFGKTAYKPLAPLSAMLSLALLAGGLMVLLLDLGRPERIIVAMTYYNFKSIFAWNIILYNVFFGVVILYLWTLMAPSMKKYTKAVGTFAFVWRLILTTGTGSIFGFLVAREAYDAAIMAPMFIIMSFSFGLAVFLLVLMAAYKWTDRPLGDALFKRLKNLLGVFVAAVLYFVMAYHLANLYATQHHGVEAFILRDGGIFTQLFWIGQIILGSLVPLALIYHPTTGKSRAAIGLASVLIILGGFCQVYIIIIGGQAYPLEIFPGKEIVETTFFEGVISSYTPSLNEILLGLGGVAVTLAIVTFMIKILHFLPASLADEDTDPHHKAA